MIGRGLITRGNPLTSTAAFDIPDDILFTFGNDSDIAMLLRSATLTADTALTGVLIGTPDTPALAANSLIIANKTADGDILIACNDGGTSQQFIFCDGSTGILHLGKPGAASGAFTGAGDVYVAGDIEVSGRIDNSVYSIYSSSFIVGGTAAAPSSFSFTTNDANALHPTFKTLTGGNYATAFVFGTSLIATTDLGGAAMDYAGQVEPILVAVDADLDSSIHFGFVSDDVAEINGKGNISELQIGVDLALADGGISVGTIKTVKVTKAHDSDLFDATALTDNVTIWQQPAGTVLLATKMRLETQFTSTDSLISDLDVTIGLAGDEDGLVAATMNLTSDAADTEYKTRGAYWDTSAEGSFWYSHSATDWVAYATAVGANLSTTTAGSIDFYFCYLEL